jgi:NADH-quinone oxidoreductase subunit L
MFDIDTLIVLIPALPLLGSIVAAIFGPKMLREKSHLPVLVTIVASFVCSVMLASQLRRELPAAADATAGNARIVTLWTWLDTDASDVRRADAQDQTPAAVIGDQSPLRVDVTLRADALTAIMLSMVTFISSLIVIYSSGYMHEDRGYWRFFAYVGLFVFSMTMLVSVSNFLLLFVFWEAVGVCSYLLIGFWYEKPSAAAAGMKAFLVNRVGDFGFALGMFLIFVTYGTLNFHDTSEVAGVLGPIRLAGGAGGYVAGGVGFAICMLLMLGACGKSAQFPLHVWLADAMEGPTPVSALIHAATMVTAGVYMVTRCTPLFLASPTAQLVVACIGGGTALMAGLIALTQFDLKRVLAYSTISQLGFMFLALGTGTAAGIAAGMFHLFTHAFFKALLFLGAGSVMHAMGGVIDIRKFGGLRHRMPITHWTFLAGCIALAGIVPFSGFWSKDAILSAVHDQASNMKAELSKRPDRADAVAESSPHRILRLTRPDPADRIAAHGEGHEPTTAYLEHYDTALIRNGATVYSILYWMSLATAVLTAVYTFRIFFLTFYGEERIPDEAGDHAHESPALMWVPLCILAAFAVAIGYLLQRSDVFHGFLLHYTPTLKISALALTPQPGVFHWDIAMVSTVAAVAGVALSAFLYLGRTNEAQGLARLFSAKVLGAPYLLAKGKFFWDEIYDVTIVRPLRALAGICYAVDRWVVDGLVNTVGWVPRALGAAIRGLQMGFIPFYALAMVLGLLSLLVAKVLWGGM